MTSDEIERGSYILQECLEHPDLENPRLIYADWCKDFDVWSEKHLRELVLKHPENDAPRLIYANFCAENKNYSTEKLIRMQISLTKLKSVKSVFPGTFETLEDYQRNLANSIINEVVLYLPHQYGNLFRTYSRSTLLSIDNIIDGLLDFPAVFPGNNPGADQIKQLHAVVGFKRGFLAEITAAPLSLWKIHGRQLVREYPIEFVHFPKIIYCVRYVTNVSGINEAGHSISNVEFSYDQNPHTEIIAYQIDHTKLPNWLRNSPYFNSSSPIFYRDENGIELLLKWVSDKLISWAKN